MSEETVQITTAEALKKNYVEPGSLKHRLLIEAGYQMSMDDADVIIKEWEKDHKSWPLEEYRKAKAMKAAAEAKPQVIDTQPGWKRQRG